MREPGDFVGGVAVADEHLDCAARRSGGGQGLERLVGADATLNIESREVFIRPPRNLDGVDDMGQFQLRVECSRQPFGDLDLPGGC